MRRLNLVKYFIAVILFFNIIFASDKFPKAISEEDAKKVGTFIALAQGENVQSCRSDGVSVIITLKNEKTTVEIPITKNQAAAKK